VLWLALTPQPPEAIDTGWDKLNHVLAFAALAVSGRFGFAAETPRVARLGLLAFVLLLIGVGIELAQARLPPRMADPRDVVADVVGIAAGLLLAAALHRAGRRWRAQGR
jgi:VanZ family protein